MAESTPVAESATTLPSDDLIACAAAFAREPFLHPGEDPVEALAPGSARRRALDWALHELEQGRDVPSEKWRRKWSMLLGLERVLSDPEPKLADGTTLNPHQVDALSGTLAALLTEAQKDGDADDDEGRDVEVIVPVLSVEAELVLEDDPELSTIEDLEELDEDDEPEQEIAEEDDAAVAVDEEQLEEQPDDPNAHKRFWFEHATGAGKTVAAMGFVDASRTGGVLILTHRRNLVDQFNDELKTRGYKKRISRPLLEGDADRADGPVTVETYQWFVRNAGKISSAYTVVICDEAHTALGEKTAGAIREWTGPVFIGMTATGALIARHVTDLFPTQTSRFDLAQAARRGVIAPLRAVRIPPGPGVRTIAKVPLRRGEVDVEFDQEMLAELLDQMPFNLAIADLYKTRFGGVPGVVYTAGVRHAYNVAQAFCDLGLKAKAVSGETPKRELAKILADYEKGKVDVLVNAQLLAEGWNSPRATVCMHLAPTASKRIYQQRVGRVTRRQQGKEAGIVVDFVHPATKNDDPAVTLHSLLDRDVYRGGAIVVGPVRRGRGRRVRVERRVVPVTPDEDRRIEVFERELWRIAVEHLDYGEQVQWAALAGARVAPSGWRRARAMLHFDREGELKRTFLLTAVRRNKNPQLRIRALQEIAAARDAEAFSHAIDEIGTWSREDKREGTKVMLQALAEKRIGEREQANQWIWQLASYTSDLHEEYAAARWPETKRLLGLLVNSSGAAHGRNARRLVQASRNQDRRLSAAILAAARAHTPEAEEVLRGARTRLSRKPGALSRDLLRNFPKRARRGKRKRGKKPTGAEAQRAIAAKASAASASHESAIDAVEVGSVDTADGASASGRGSRNGRSRAAAAATGGGGGRTAGVENGNGSAENSELTKPVRKRHRPRKPKAAPVTDEQAVSAVAAAAELLAKPVRTPPVPRTAAAAVPNPAPHLDVTDAAGVVSAPKRARRAPKKVTTAATGEESVTAASDPASESSAAPAPKPRRPRKPKADVVTDAAADAPDAAPSPAARPRRPRASRAKAAVDADAAADAPAEPGAALPTAAKPRRARKPKAEPPADGDGAGTPEPADALT